MIGVVVGLLLLHDAGRYRKVNSLPGEGWHRRAILVEGLGVLGSHLQVKAQVQQRGHLRVCSSKLNLDRLHTLAFGGTSSNPPSMHRWACPRRSPVLSSAAPRGTRPAACFRSLAAFLQFGTPTKSGPK